jgi:hypothetical protein
MVDANPPEEARIFERIRKIPTLSAIRLGRYAPSLMASQRPSRMP